MKPTDEGGVVELLSVFVEDVSEAASRNVIGAHLLQEFLSAPWLCALLQIYECLLTFKRLWPCPVLPHASGLSREVQGVLHMVQTPSVEATELQILLSSPHMKALLSCHDAVAQADFGPVMAPLPDVLPEDEEAVRIVRLVKKEQTLGATIRKDKETGEIFIARVIPGGLADRSGLLHPGDLLVEVDGKPLVGLEPEQVIQILMRSEGTILFKVVPNGSQLSSTNKPVYMRAMVDYCPLQDLAIPCPDVGLVFSKGDVLEVLDQSDGRWWKARKMSSSASCTGLIPSPATLKSKQNEPREGKERTDNIKDDECGSGGGGRAQEEPQDKVTSEAELSDIPDGLYLTSFRRSFCLLRRSMSKRRRQSCTSISASCSTLATPYEEVVHYRRPPQDRHRLVILVGASGVGVNELRQTLIQVKPDTFHGPVPHTTRPIRAWEQTGREYHFVTKELFDYMLCSHRFVEYGEFEGHKYGTSIDAINEAIKLGRVCIIDIEPQNIPPLRTRKYKPYVIFIKAPSLEKLAQTTENASIVCTYQHNRNFTKEDINDLMETSRQMELKYKHLFDEVLVNEQLNDTCAKLYVAVQRAQEGANWIPVSWTRTQD
ncbi:MAGUK p55 subfamily member 4-like isoform X2 [Phyllopteryx taeniolatus]|uniref:MAGUK p55 subfamily member 4-like isoform X2 n=1 Tax=Phyllopteryx taeniolatus TaxID=161469 RepID=UPI002AD35BE8|nr:MAGUK p55 subfamily member 4-like isoform X2 [Phyllopteryx taeniolatus]XP_061648823.1 MAGUK p55 subfamily member 4-like isoform X2 [Phyllopteryx taeniolatus]XP_061648824.1 MAGUK p55 subfamily member 4-like isoform X2 [Phyllopteryx taeniolatus]